MKDTISLETICNRIRYNILTSTTTAGSGHPTSSLSATELISTLYFGNILKYDFSNPTDIRNDRFILSKGHASPLLYAIYETCGAITNDQLLSLRMFSSDMEGHPTPRIPFVDVASGSLGQGLSIGAGMAIALQNIFSKDAYKPEEIPHVYVLMGDSEFVEGQVWEAMQIASFYNLHNLVGIIDVNKLGQRGKTMLAWDMDTYKKRVESFGWNAYVLKDGHDLEQVQEVYKKIQDKKDNKPSMIIARTIKGCGVSFLEDTDGFHGKSLTQEQLDEAIEEIGHVDRKMIIPVPKPDINSPDKPKSKEIKLTLPSFDEQSSIATREAYGETLVSLGESYDDVFVLDAETSNSTFAEVFLKKFPQRYREMFIAEQNMVSVAVGISKLGFVPFVSTFAAFFSRTFDQIRMAQYSEANLKIVGSHAGVSIGQDGSSQMGLEDIAMMRSILDSVVLYPSDPVSAAQLIKEMYKHTGISYIRLTREKTPLLYKPDDSFFIGGSYVLHESKDDVAVVVTAGITLHEAEKAYKDLKKEGKTICIIDAYSIKPLDEKTIKDHANRVKHVIIVEDHYPAGGLGEAVMNALRNESGLTIIHLAVQKIPRSGKPDELLKMMKIDAQAIIETVKKSQA